MKNKIRFSLSLLALTLAFSLQPSAFAQQTPPGCSGITLWTGFYTDTQACSPGDTIRYGVTVANDLRYNPLDCDVTGLAVTITTPDYVTHSITLFRTTLTSGQYDDYPNAVSYVVSASDVRQDGTVKATSLTTDSQSSTNRQGVNAKVILPVPAPVLVPAITQLQAHAAVTDTNVTVLQTNVANLNATIAALKKANRLK